MSVEETIELSPNYQHWRAEGHLWQQEYDERKKFLAYYHIQELMLADYVINSQATRVLEYGCGVGRHLYYLSKLPNVDVYGYDQSQGMADHIRAWAAQEWFDDHVAVGLPVTRLPYADKSFDIVYTSEVLIHIRPADLPFVLGELIRVTRGQLLHLEPSPTAYILRNAHDGSWSHDIVSLYAQLGFQCDILPNGFVSQVPYRVVLDPSQPLYTWSPVELGLYRRLEHDLQPTLDRAQALQERHAELEPQLAATQAHIQRLSDDRDRLWGEVQQWKTDHDQAQEMRTTVSADRDRLWQEVQQWKTDYDQTQSALSLVTDDRDRLWQEVQQWQADYDQTQIVLATMTADRDRLWQEIQQWQVEHAQGQTALTLITADRDRLWQEAQQWQADYDQTQTVLATMTADRDRLWQEIQQSQAEREQTQTSLATLATEQQRLRATLQQLATEHYAAQQELEPLRQSRIIRRIQKVQQHPAYRFVRSTTHRLRHPLSTIRALSDRFGFSDTIPVTIRTSGAHHPESQDSEVWLLDIATKDLGHTYSWSRIVPTSGWQLAASEQSHQKQALVANGSATLHLRVPPDAILRLLQHPWSGILELETQGRTKRVDLFSSQSKVIAIQLNDHSLVKEQRTDTLPQSILLASAPWTADEERWLRTIQTSKPAAIAITHPDWRGVRSSMENLLSYQLLLADDLDPIKAERVARMIVESGCERVVLGGFQLTHVHLVQALKRLAPRTCIYVFWLGTFLQTNEDYGWQGFKLIDQLCRAGLVTKWGFAKHGMAEIIGRTGVPTGFVMSYVRSLPEEPSHPAAGGPHIGVWAIEPIWRKSPYAMLAATSLIEHAHVIGRGQNERVHDFARFLHINATLHDKPLPREAMPAALAQMHLNLYVTLSECTPMLPLESLAAGAPCLIGPTSHLFEDHPYLHSRLVVPSPDRAFVIAQYIEQALAERDQIVLAYKAYAPGYNARAQASLRAFLEVDAAAVL